MFFVQDVRGSAEMLANLFLNQNLYKSCMEETSALCRPDHCRHYKRIHLNVIQAHTFVAGSQTFHKR